MGLQDSPDPQTTFYNIGCFNRPTPNVPEYFTLRADSPGSDSKFLYRSAFDGDDGDDGNPARTRGEAGNDGMFSLDHLGQLVNNDHIASVTTDGALYPGMLLLPGPGYSTHGLDEPRQGFYCEIDGCTGAFSCPPADGSDGYFSDCAGSSDQNADTVFLNEGNEDAACKRVTLTAIETSAPATSS